MNDPGARQVTFEQLRTAYGEQARALIEGGVDILMVETIFDTLNAKAAVFAVLEAFDALGIRLPLMISGTITDQSGRTLTGQTPEAFYNSLRHASPLAVGLNCASAPTSCGHTCRSCPPSASTRSAATPTPACPTSSAATTSRPRTWPHHG